jgi:membrane fusion protein (multidrug efflux system)
MKRLLTWATAAILVAGGGYGFRKWGAGKDADPTRLAGAGAGAGAGGSGKAENREKGARGKGAPLRVSSFLVKPQAFAETVQVTGTLRAEEGVELQAETNGKVVAILFEEGGRVAKGDLLVKLNDNDLRATLARASSRRELALRRKRRIEQLFRDGIANEEELDTVLNDVAVQEADVALTQAQIAMTEIRAPFDGVVGLRFVSEGAFVNASSRVATLQRLDRLKVDFPVPERLAGRVRKGSPVTFSVAGVASRTTGSIYAFDPRIDSMTRTLLVRAVCPNPEGRLLPGAFASVEITLSEVSDAILIPALAVIPGVADKNVFVAVDGKVVRRPVETGTRTETSVHVLSGLKPGDVVITSGLQQMRAGMEVDPVIETPRPAVASGS